MLGSPPPTSVRTVGITFTDIQDMTVLGCHFHGAVLGSWPEIPVRKTVVVCVCVRLNCSVFFSKFTSLSEYRLTQWLAYQRRYRPFDAYDDTCSALTQATGNPVAACRTLHAHTISLLRQNKSTDSYSTHNVWVLHLLTQNKSTDSFCTHNDLNTRSADAKIKVSSAEI